MKTETDAERRAFIIDNLQNGISKQEIMLTLALSTILDKSIAEIDESFSLARMEFNAGFNQITFGEKK